MYFDIKKVKWLDKEPIHLFLDTTLTFQDPFFKKNFNHQLIRLSEIHAFPIFMSKVVYDETRNKYELNVKERISSLESALKELENYYPTNLDTVTIKCTLDDFMKQFDEYYLDLIERKILHIIEYDNSMLPILVERSIKRIKPFGSKKQEFRDAITWLSYVKFAEANNLDNCFLITNNLDDFCDNKIKNTIHPELLKDSNKFKHFVSAKDLLDIETKLQPYILSAEITEWLQAFEIDSEFVEEKLNGELLTQLEEEFSNYVDNRDMDRVVNTSNVLFDGYVQANNVSVVSIEEITTTIINDQVVVTGDVYVDIEVILYYEDDEDYGRTAKVGEDTAQLVATFTFTMDKESVHKDSLEFDNFDVIQVADFSYLRDYDDD